MNEWAEIITDVWWEIGKELNSETKWTCLQMRQIVIMFQEKRWKKFRFYVRQEFTYALSEFKCHLMKTCMWWSDLRIWNELR